MSRPQQRMCIRLQTVMGAINNYYLWMSCIPLVAYWRIFKPPDLRRSRMWASFWMQEVTSSDRSAGSSTIDEAAHPYNYKFVFLPTSSSEASSFNSCPEVTASLVSAFVTIRLDYYNAVLAELPKSTNCVCSCPLFILDAVQRISMNYT